MGDIRRTRKTQRDGHNSGVQIWSLCSVSSTLSHANLEQPFRTLAINVRGKYNSKEVFLRRLFLRLLSLRRYVSSIYMYATIGHIVNFVNDVSMRSWWIWRRCGQLSTHKNVAWQSKQWYSNFVYHARLDALKNYMRIICEFLFIHMTMYIIIFKGFASSCYSYLPNPSAQAGYDTRSIFKRSLTGLNSEFSFS